MPPSGVHVTLDGGATAVALIESFSLFLDRRMYEVDNWVAHKWESAMVREQRFKAQATATSLQAPTHGN